MPTAKAAAILAALMSLPATLPAIAADPATPSTIKDLPPGYDLKGDVPDILGLSPGMTGAEAAPILSKLAAPGKSPYPLDGVQGLRDPSSAKQFGFAYHQGDNVTAATTTGQGMIELRYSTALTGGRIASINRDDTYWMGDTDPSAMPDVAGLVKSITGKYGKPTFSLGDPGNSMDPILMSYVWVDGALKSDDRKAYDKCQGVAAQSPTYVFIQPRNDRFAGCTMLLEFHVNRYAQKYSAAADMKITLFDYRRVFDDAVIADKFLLDGLNGSPDKPAGPQPNL